MQRRPYQHEAIQAIRKEYLAGFNKQILCMSTGSGKTPTVGWLLDDIKDILPGRSVFLVHRDELAQQAIDKIGQINPHFNIQQEAGSYVADGTADLVVASVQTLGREGTGESRARKFRDFDKFIVDEAHRGVAQSYRNVYGYCGLMNPDSKQLLLGVTATPSGRSDGQGLGEIFQKISYTYTLRQAIEDGWLVDVCGIRVDTDTSLDSVATKAGDYDQKQLAKTVNTPIRNSLVALAYMEHCEGRQAIGFGVDIEHSKALADTFKAYGLNAEYVYGADPQRDQKIQDFRDGKIKILFNAQLLVEGFDLPSISCVIMAAPTKSSIVFSQRVGRGTRICEGKEDCIILDVVDCSYKHNLTTLPTLLGLPKTLNLQGHGLVASVKQIEEEQEKYPHLDFTGLLNINDIKTYVEKVNLFEVKFPEELESVSNFVWHPQVTGGYILMLPNKDSVRIVQNVLDKYEVRAYIRGQKYKGERDTMQEAFYAADKLVMDVAGDLLKLVKKDAGWHNTPATEAQLNLLKKLFKGKQIPNNLTKGQASRLIGSVLANK
jgi:ATP-dependent helicase IRC3